MKCWVWIAGWVLAGAVTSSAQIAFPPSYAPRPEALAALVSDDQVRVELIRDVVAVFHPASGRPTKGLILYPGGLVDYRAYAPLARSVAANGYRVVLVKPPLDLAILGTWLVNPIIGFYGDISTWAVGGHSLGGVAAAQVGQRNVNRTLRGVVLLASFPSRSSSLARSGRSVVSIFGTEDGLTEPGDIYRTLNLLPGNAVLVPVVGANHTQFGSYWDGEDENFLQPGDRPATILPETQIQSVADVISAFMRSL